jgi:hypothetical protein
VHLVNRSLKLVTVTAIAMATAAVMGVAAGSASASTTALARTTAHVAAEHAGISPAMTPKKTKAPRTLQPKGCNNRQFCEYNKGNGGSLCFQTGSDSSEWPSACGYHNQGEYNRGSNAIYMYSGPGYIGCYYLLYSGNYLLYNADDDFQGGPEGCTTLTMATNLDSSKFV